MYNMKYSHPCAIQHKSLISDVPPYSWDMPIEVFQAYFAIDSLCRTASAASVASESLDDMIKVSNVKWLLPYIFKIINYDPYKFFSYCELSKYLNSQYIVPPSWLFDYMFDRSLGDEIDKADALLAYSAGIYHLKVIDVSIDSVYDGLGPYAKDALICVTGEVLNTMKGGSLEYKEDEPENGGVRSVIRYSYAKHWKTMHYNSDEVVHGFKNVYLPDEYGYRHDPVVGGEYILFARMHMENHVDSLGVPYNIFPMWGYSRNGGVYECSNGVICDDDHIFEMGREVGITNFIGAIAARIQALGAN